MRGAGERIGEGGEALDAAHDQAVGPGRVGEDGAGEAHGAGPEDTVREGDQHLPGVPAPEPRPLEPKARARQVVAALLERLAQATVKVVPHALPARHLRDLGGDAGEGRGGSAGAEGGGHGRERKRGACHRASRPAKDRALRARLRQDAAERKDATLSATDPDFIYVYLGPYPHKAQHCPRCSSKEVTYSDGCSTAMGFFSLDGNPTSEDDDPNVTAKRGRCMNCYLEFTHLSKPSERATWITVDDYVVAGSPATHEHRCLVPCACGAWAKNAQKGKTVSMYPDPVTGIWITEPAPFWDCAACGYHSVALPTPPTVHAPASTP